MNFQEPMAKYKPSTQGEWKPGVHVDMLSYLDNRYSKFIISNYFCSETQALKMLLLTFDYSNFFVSVQ